MENRVSIKEVGRYSEARRTEIARFAPRTRARERLWSGTTNSLLFRSLPPIDRSLFPNELKKSFKVFSTENQNVSVRYGEKYEDDGKFESAINGR